jgi:hypothetical protein
MTNRELIREAFMLAKVLTQGIAPTAEMEVDGLSAMNDMLLEWTADEVDVGYYVQSDLAAESPVFSDAYSAVKASLAIKLAGLYETEPHPSVLADAIRGYKRLERDSVSSQVPELDMGHWPSGFNPSFDIENG